MRVAIVGTGAFAKYFINEFTAAGIEVVVLTRSHKSFLDGKKGVMDQRITDYSSVPQLVELLSDCDALVSAIFDLTRASADVHLTLIEACKQTPKCKRFIPSDFFNDTETFPEIPDGWAQFNIPVKEALKAQNELEWTVVSMGWIMDYIVPSANRYHPDIGLWFPLDHQKKTMTIVGTGNEVFSITSPRDVAKATAELLKNRNKWSQFTFMQGEETTLLQVAEEVKTAGGISDLKVIFEPLDKTQEEFGRLEVNGARTDLEFKLTIPSGIVKLDQEKVKRDQAAFFPNVHFRTMRELLEAAKQEPNAIV
ncbi:Oxidoreductase swnR [Phytophthora citrophthora]|uniref:Oxidoreductase swnR n=1 Tax=Phytophthora citrophthora TaxID=4793 RepID=A0AAD9GLZ1_9STRA|nr:Oxidoreductase swnR [Phytophthora citrophthora]